MEEYEQKGFCKRKEKQHKPVLFSSNKVEGIQISRKLHGYILHTPMAHPYS